jgi:plasmid stabilization system protein ParE
VKYTLHQEAEADLDSIVDRYLMNFGRAAAERFLQEYQRVVGIIVENPGMGTPASRGRRRYPLKVVPYLIVYREAEEGVRILVVRHQHRNPRLGERRN